MDKQASEVFEEELAELIARHGVTAAAFCGRHGENFIAFHVPRTMTAPQYMETVCNIGRLWQYSREQVRTFLDAFERR